MSALEVVAHRSRLRATRLDEPGLRRAGTSAAPWLLPLVLWLTLLPLFIAGALELYTFTQRVMASVLFVLAVTPLLRYARRRRGIPLIELVSLQYGLLFALPVFFEQRLDTVAGPIVPPASAITATLALAIVALIALRAGYGFSRSNLRINVRYFTFAASEKRLFWYAFVMTAGSVLISGLAGQLAPEALVHPFGVVLSNDLGIALLACLFYSRMLPRWKRGLALGLLAASAASGLAGGMVQSAVQPVAIWLICRWLLGGRLPVTGMVVIALVFFLLQPIKGEYRTIVWYSDHQFSTSERLALYGKLIQDQWSGRLSDGATVLAEGQKSAAQRLSMLQSTAHYIALTPSQVDYKRGATLLYVFESWIPRVIWPDKPIAQLANKLMPVEYGIQPASTLNTTMYGVGHLAEAYANFGIVGILPIFLAIGILYSLPFHLVGGIRTIPALAVFLALTMSIVPIGSTIVEMCGGVLQQAFLQMLMLRLFTARRKQDGAIGVLAVGNPGTPSIHRWRARPPAIGKRARS